MRLCVQYTRRLRPQPIIRSLFDRRTPRPRLTPQRIYNNKIYNIILYMWSASAVGRPGRAFAPEQVHRQSARPSVRPSVTPAARRLRVRVIYIFVVRCCITAYVYNDAYIVRVFFFPPEKPNKTRPVVERRGGTALRVSRKVICNKFRTRSAAAAHLMYTTTTTTTTYNMEISLT